MGPFATVTEYGEFVSFLAFLALLYFSWNLYDDFPCIICDHLAIHWLRSRSRFGSTSIRGRFRCKAAALGISRAELSQSFSKRKWASRGQWNSDSAF